MVDGLRGKTLLCILLMVSVSDIRKDTMTKTEQAGERLYQAVARAEAALEIQVGINSATGSDALAALEVSRVENASLRAVNDDISTRLDAAIGRLKVVLEGQE